MQESTPQENIFKTRTEFTTTRSNKMKVIALAILLLPAVTFGYSLPDAEADSALILQQIYTLNEAQETQTIEAVTAPRSSWPTTHPSSAVHKVFSWFDDSFDFYIWRSGGYTWIEIDPLSSAFICGPSFSIVQNGRLYDSVKLEKYSGGSQCGDVFLPTVFQFDQYTFGATANLDGAFSLYFDSDNIDSMSVPSISATPAPEPEPEQVEQPVILSSELDLSIPVLRYGPNETRMWAEFGFYGYGEAGELLWELKGYGFVLP